MPQPAITYAIVTIGLIMIALFLIYTLVLPRFSIALTDMLVPGYELHIGKYTIIEIKSNTIINVRNLPQECNKVYKNPSTLYVICECSSNTNIITVEACAGSICKTFIIKCK